ncbi:protocadherin beta-6-like [Amphiura filiformis]|uniref:protocadherin beta-6-like n=1 Tax=Amphiura filiformis TaxID=82378 RepID=UPI003B2138D6
MVLVAGTVRAWQGMDKLVRVTVRDPLSLADCSYGLNVTVNIQVENLSPQFTNDIYNGEVDESAPVSTSVATVGAVDKDGDSTYIVYRLTTANDNGMDIFSIDEITGEISVKTAGLLDAELISKYTLYVEADDTKLDVIRSASASVVVSVRDINDNSPVCDDDTVDIFEDAPIGRPVLAVQASDLDQNDVLSYSLTNLPTDFEIDSNTGLITVSGQLDREPPGPDFYSLQVLVSDGTNTGVCRVDITILDVNDNAPVFTLDDYDLSVNEDQNNAAITVSASDIDSGNNAAITYTLLPTSYDVTVDPISKGWNSLVLGRPTEDVHR